MRKKESGGRENGERKPLRGGEGSQGVDVRDRLFAYYIDLINAGQAIEIERLRWEHPEHASELIRDLEIFLEVGGRRFPRRYFA